MQTYAGFTSDRYPLEPRATCRDSVGASHDCDPADYSRLHTETRTTTEVRQITISMRIKGKVLWS